MQLFHLEQYLHYLQCHTVLSMVLLASHILTHQDDNSLVKLHKLFHGIEHAAIILGA